ncbi:MAG: TonB-dependent receptor [Parvularculaceae bacterium]|nr:TonB-dependent receptor [Parvularculaceae bacterium]
MALSRWHLAHRGASLIVLTMLAPTLGYAQTTDEADEVRGLDTVFVTAQRKTESAQTAAIAIDTVQPDEIAGVTNPSQLTNLVPAVQFGAAGGSSPLLYVRGVGTFSANPYTDSAVAINYDGVYLARSTSMHGFFYDLERIEVLKGPQGTLYGRNATGGAVNILPAKPVIGEFGGNLTVSGGNYESISAQGGINIPTSENSALRIAGTVYTHDGYLSDDTQSEEGYGFRAQWLYQPSDRFNVRLAGDFFDLGGTGPASVVYGLRNPITGIVTSPGFGRDVGTYDPRTDAIYNAAFVPTAGATNGTIDRRPNIDNQYFGLSAEINADLGFGELTVIPSWRRSELSEAGRGSAFLLLTDEVDEQFSIEARLAGSFGEAVDWLAGVYYFDASTDSDYRIAANIQGGSQALNSDDQSLAGFGRLTFNLTDTFRFVAAGRYTADDKSFVGNATNLLAICTDPGGICPNIRRLPTDFLTADEAMAQIGYIQPFPGAPYIDPTMMSSVIYTATPVVVNETSDTDKFTYRLAVEFEPRPESLLYASYETGYRTGGFSFSTVAPTFEPESIKAYTIGSKNRFFDNRVQFNVEAFIWKYKDQQVAHTAIGAGGGIEFATENIGASTNKGFEVGILALPLENTQLSVDMQYLDASYDEFVYLEPDTSVLAGLPPGTIPPTINCPIAFVPASGQWQVDCSGADAYRSPKWTMNLGLQQTIPLSGSRELVFDVNTHYQSDSMLMFERLDSGIQESYWTTNASLSLALNDNWAVAVFVNNIEDNRPLTNSFFYPFASVVTGTVAPPRTFGGRLSVRF